MEAMHEQTRNVPIRGEYDVVVCGGGLGGTASALAATGKNVIVAEIRNAS